MVIVVCLRRVIIKWDVIVTVISFCEDIVLKKTFIKRNAHFVDITGHRHSFVILFTKFEIFIRNGQIILQLQNYILFND